jgi:hypothetical protein
MADAWRLFGDVVAPAPVVPGFVLAASIGAWWIAFAADTAAFRANAVAEAAFPATTLFVFGSALGAPRNRVAVTAVFLASLLAYWVSQRPIGGCATRGHRGGWRATPTAAPGRCSAPARSSGSPRSSPASSSAPSCPAPTPRA